MIAPLPAGAVQLRSTLPSVLAVPETPVGASGTAAARTLLEAIEADPVPWTLVAVTVNVYAVPTESPATLVHVPVAVNPVQPVHAGLTDTVYPVMLAPLSLGAVQETLIDPSAWSVAVTPVGAAGTVAGTTAGEDADEGPIPATLVADTVKVYELPYVSPPMVAEVPAEVRPLQLEQAGSGVTM
jgi:hypothetical protein